MTETQKTPPAEQEAGTTARACGVQNPWQPNTKCTLRAGHPVPTEVELYGPGTAPVTCDHAEPEHTATTWVMGNQAATRGGNLMATPYPAPADAPEGEAHVELVTLLSELVSVHLPTSPSHSEVEAVIALAGLVRNERGLTDVDPQDDPGPEELRVQGARRFVDWLAERNLLRSREDEQWAGFPPTVQGLVTSWLNGERQKPVREDDPVSTAPKVEVYIGDKKLEPDCQHQIELLRAELSRATHRAVMFNQVLAERDDLKRTLESVKDERDQANAQTTKLAGAHQDGIRRALALGRREGRAEVQQAKPADAVWDFLDWLQGKGWELSTEWPVGPGDETYAISAKPGSEDQKGLVEGWHWARHGKWEHERGQQPTEAPGDDETETTKTPEPGSFAYEHEETSDRG